ncbi:MAG: VWA domain-containing protein, partial [Peptococcia bacterium]
MKKQGIRRIISLILLFTFMLGSLLPANVAWAEEMGQEQLATLDESAESAESTVLIEECSEEASLNEDTTMLDDSEQVAEYDDGNASDINEVEPFIETFGLMASGSDDEKFDIVFLLDSSGSMEWNDPDNYRIQGTIECVNLLGADDRGAIVEFAYSANTLQELTSNIPRLREKAGNVGSSGGTNIYSGLNEALGILEQNGRSDANKEIILLTDGSDSSMTSSRITEVNQRTDAANIRISCIGFGSANGSLLTTISEPSGGIFEFANSVEDVVRAFLAIFDYMGKLKMTGKEAKEYVKQFSDEYIRNNYLYADPINTASGAHVITLPIFQVNGAYSYDFNLRYNSLLTDEGPLGNGWSHDFGARLEFVTDHSINVYWNTNNYNRFYSTDGVNFTSYNATVACDKLVKNSDGTYTLVKPNQEKYEFDAQGRLVAKTNQIRQQLQLSYTDDQLTAITDPISNTVVTLSYNENGFINQIIDAGNREYEFTYDSDNNLIEIKNVSLDQTLNYTYNEDGQVLTGSKNGSIIFENTYDEEGRVAVQADGNGNLTYFAYDEETKPGIVLTTITDREGNTRIVEHDTNYNLVKAIDENNETTEYTYDAKGNMLTQKNARGYTTTYTYDERGNLLTIEDAKGRVTRMSYDARNNLT